MNQMAQLPQLPKNAPSWNALIVISSSALFVGFLAGALLARAGHSSEVATAELAKTLSKPLNLQVSVTNATQQFQPGKLLGSVVDAATTALQVAEAPGVETAKRATVAADEFVKELSGGIAHTAGEKLVDGFAELISSGFKPSSDKEKDAQAVTNYFVTNNLATPGPSLPAPALSQRKPVRILFGINRASLGTLANKMIGDVRDFAAANPGTIILLTGNADTLGSERVNRGLAARRSKTVRERLTSAGGIAENRVFAADLGNTSLPIVTSVNTPEEQNRSVTIEVRR